MKFFESLNPIVIAAVGVGVLVLIFIILYSTVISRRVLKKQVRECGRNFDYLHTTLFGQDSQFIKRLELISRTNLLYVDVHMKYNKRYKDVRDMSDANAQQMINKAKDMIASKQWKSLKEFLPSLKETIAQLEIEVNSLNKDLLSVIKPEEECRTESLDVKDKVRKLKQDYYIKQADLTLLSESFDVFFANIDKCFKSFESYVESALYDEARQTLKEVEYVVEEFNKIFPKLPDLCANISLVIPEKIKDLLDRYNELNAKKFPLGHLSVKSSIDEIYLQLDALKAKLQKFDLSNVSEIIEGILTRIDNFYDSFDKEEEAKVTFDEECDSIYSLDTQIEKRYIKLCNKLPEVKGAYIISEIQEENIGIIREHINKTGATKRSLDTFIHGGTSQPYTVLVAKMHQLRDEANECSSLLDDFDTYILSMKEDCESAFGLLIDYHSKIKKAQIAIRSTNINVVIEKYIPMLEDTLGIIDNLYTTMVKSPIDVQKVNGLTEDLKQQADSALGEVFSTLNLQQEAEKEIVYGNRDRMHLSDLHQLLKQTENLYFNGDFVNSLEETKKALHSIKAGEN